MGMQGYLRFYLRKIKFPYHILEEDHRNLLGGELSSVSDALFGFALSQIQPIWLFYIP